MQHKVINITNRFRSALQVTGARPHRPCCSALMSITHQVKLEKIYAYSFNG